VVRVRVRVEAEVQLLLQRAAELQGARVREYLVTRRQRRPAEHLVRVRARVRVGLTLTLTWLEA